MSTRLLTTRQVAELLAVSPETVLRLHRRGELAGYRIASNALRFAEADVSEWLESRRATPERRVPGWVS